MKESGALRSPQYKYYPYSAPHLNCSSRHSWYCRLSNGSKELPVVGLWASRAATGRANSAHGGTRGGSASSILNRDVVAPRPNGHSLHGLLPHNRTGSVGWAAPTSAAGSRGRGESWRRGGAGWGSEAREAKGGSWGCRRGGLKYWRAGDVESPRTGSALALKACACCSAAAPQFCCTCRRGLQLRPQL